jgi:DNA mismatch repair protein MSH6
MAGVDEEVVIRAESISDEFFQAFKIKLRSKRQSALPLEAQADFVFLMNTAMKATKKQKGIHEESEDMEMGDGAAVSGLEAKHWKMASIKDQLNVIRRSIGNYEK